MTEESRTGVAMLSFAHVHARDYAAQVENHSHLRLVAIWDEDGARGRMEAERRGVPFYTELDQVLALPEVEAVVVCAPTFMHRDILIAAAQAHKHIFTEKALTINVQEATEVMRAVEDAGIRFMISLPSRSRPEILFAKKMVDEGYLGDITLMRARVAHMAALDRWFSGGSAWFGEESKAGGGAFFDLGCHRVDIMRWFLGEPASVVAQMTNFSGAYEVDDNMVATVAFRSGAIGILDVSWVHRYGPNPLEIYGTQGYLGVDQGPAGPRIQLISQRATPGEVHGCITPATLPTALPTPIQQWVSAIREGTTPHINIYDAWALTQMLENCYRAAREHREISF